MALMSENNKVTILDLDSNNIGTPGVVALLKSLRFSLVNDLQISWLEGLSQKVGAQVEDFSSALNKYIRCPVCLASVRTNRRIGQIKVLILGSCQMISSFESRKRSDSSLI